MTAKPRLLDLFCKAGGAARGYQRAGFYVVGVDLEPQPRYAGDEFHQADALAFPLEGFDAIHASPPCQAYTTLRTLHPGHTYPDLITPTRTRLIAAGVPWVMENVPGAPLRPDLRLCGAMFGLRTYRHRWFESSVFLLQPGHPPHLVRTSSSKRRACWDAGMHVSVTGNVGVYVGPDALGIDWMTGAELSQAIPPAYTEFIGRQLLDAITAAKGVSA